MGRGGGGSGSSRSSGSSGGRGFGGSSSHSSRGGGSSSFNRGGSSYRSSGPSVHVTHHYHHGPSYGYRRTYGPTVYVGGRAGSFIGSCIVILMIAVILFMLVGGASSGVAKSTVEREPLKPYASFDKNAIDDDANWIHDKKTLQRGMESFYKDTGIQPALAVYEKINGERYLRDSEINQFMTKEYDSLIGHERGLLLLFCEYADSDYYVYYMTGEDAQTVMDSEACDILVDYVHSLYSNNSLSDEEFFGQVFSKTGDRIMAVTPTVASRIPMMVIGVVVIAGFVFVFKMVKQKHKRDAEKAAETERILNTPIDRI